MLSQAAVPSYPVVALYSGLEFYITWTGLFTWIWGYSLIVGIMGTADDTLVGLFVNWLFLNYWDWSVYLLKRVDGWLGSTCSSLMNVFLSNLSFCGIIGAGWTLLIGYYFIILAAW